MTEASTPKRQIAILGSTGSIGTQTLEVIEEQHEHLQVSVLTANSKADLLIQQALKFKPNAVVIADESKYQQVKDALFDEGIKVFAGDESLEQVVQMEEIDIVLTAMVGFSGLRPTLSAIDAGKAIALANKETLVVAGELITKKAAAKAVNIYPVDSEHSAIFQCMAGEFHNPIEKIILTASGGPFRGWSREALKDVKPSQALKHPNWDMGAKITIDSASLMNKGLEVMEACWLFAVKPEQVEVVVHPQSVIHSMVQFRDGSIKAQLGIPDMKLPIQYALTYPQRQTNAQPRFSFTDYPQLTFEDPDLETFRNLTLAFEAFRKGGNMPCILNAANEIAVAGFLEAKVGFLEMAEIIEKVMEKVPFIGSPSLDQFLATDKEARRQAKLLLNG